jgi:predicted MFS family arabinose efflux permease
MGATIYLFTYLGNWLDEKYPKNIKLYSLILSVFGVLVSIYVINKQLQRINSN